MRGYMLLVAGLAFSGALFSQAQKDREPKRVDVGADVANRYPDIEGQVLTGNVVFNHNGAVITCDSAVMYNSNHIDCFRNVIINKDSTYVYGDRVEYNGNLNMARVYSPVVKVIDGTATLYTYNFTFNTLDNIGLYYGGGVMYQDDNVLESEKGYYFSDLREMVGVRNVEMKNEEYRIISDSVRYNMDTKVASFYTKTYIWTDEGEIIAADRGRYNTQDSTYFFYGNAYIMSEFRETWGDTIDFNAKRRDAILYGNIQINDEENYTSAFGDYGQYWGERGETLLTRNPSLFNYSEEHNNSDTLYMRSDTLYMFVIYPSDRSRRTVTPSEDPHSHLRFADALPDSIRLSIADSLSPVIRGLRIEADDLRRAADSIMNALYPPLPEDMQPGSTNLQEEDAPDTLRGDTSFPPPAAQAEEALAVTEETTDTGEETSSRRRRNRGPNPDFRFFTQDTVRRSDSLAAVAPIPPTEMVTDSLSQMEKVRELLPPGLSRQEAASLLTMIAQDNVPDEMSHLVSDSIDLAALRNILQEAVNTPAEAESPSLPQPETAEQERYMPPEVQSMYRRIEELTARADSLQTAETYIRPQPQDTGSKETAALDSLMLVSAADSLSMAGEQQLTDSLAHLDTKALKKYRKEEKRRLKVERKAAKKAEKRRLKEEKRAAKVAIRDAKEAERRRRIQEKRGRGTETPLSDSTAMADSLPMFDSLPPLQIDSLEKTLPAEEPEAKGDTTERIVRGWHDVRIWRKDVQAVCDSIVGFSRDSTIHMYENPVFWYGNSQVVSDSLTLYTAGEEIERAEFFGNPIMGSKIDDNQFNQVTGRTMTSWFRNNEVYHHYVEGNAEAFYYLQEDEAGEDGETRAGPPEAFLVITSSNISFLMEDQFIRYINARGNPVWPVYPLDQIPGTQPVRLQGFRWHEDRKPELKDVFDRSIRPAEREFHEALEQPKFPIAARINRRREYLIENRMWADRVDPVPAYAVEFVRSLQQ